jgi:N-acetylglucosamine kinase-like BadF-type ATPase
MTQYFLGADVGATKTNVLVVDQDGQMAGFGASGAGNHEVVGYQGLQHTLATAADQALMAAGITRDMLAGAGFGIAGYDWPSEREPTLQAVRAIGIRSPLEVVNDTNLGLMAGASDGWGVAVVSGTGCNCRGWAKNHEREGRVVGRSSLVGEAAGASELMSKVFEAIAHEWTRRGPHTQLTPILIHHLGARSLEDLLEGVCEGYYELKASAAPLVFQAAAGGDPVAHEILRWAGSELGELANSVIRQLEFESLDFEVILVGSLYDGGPLLVDPMRQTIHHLAPGARLLRLTAAPVVGAVLLGMEAAGYRPTGAVRSRLNSINGGC